MPKQAAYTLGSIEQVRGTLISNTVRRVSVPVVLHNGEVYGTNLSGLTIEEIMQAIDYLNAADRQAEEYLGQFATEEEIAQHVDENSIG